MDKRHQIGATEAIQIDNQTEKTPKPPRSRGLDFTAATEFRIDSARERGLQVYSSTPPPIADQRRPPPTPSSCFSPLSRRDRKRRRLRRRELKNNIKKKKKTFFFFYNIHRFFTQSHSEKERRKREIERESNK